MPYHYFDGQLIARKNREGKFYLQDTYWGSGDTTFTPKEASENGTLVFVCNLNETEKKGDAYSYYDEKDIYNLSSQHGCYKDIRIRKGAKRSKAKMFEVINEKINEARRKVHGYIEDIARYSETKTKIETGDLSVYL